MAPATGCPPTVPSTPRTHRPHANYTRPPRRRWGVCGVGVSGAATPALNEDEDITVPRKRRTTSTTTQSDPGKKGGSSHTPAAPEPPGTSLTPRLAVPRVARRTDVAQRSTARPRRNTHPHRSAKSMALRHIEYLSARRALVYLRVSAAIVKTGSGNESTGLCGISASLSDRRGIRLTRVLEDSRGLQGWQRCARVVDVSTVESDLSSVSPSGGRSGSGEPGWWVLCTAVLLLATAARAQHRPIHLRGRPI